jgi:L-lactate dehydrogenase complex protein LldG
MSAARSAILDRVRRAERAGKIPFVDRDAHVARAFRPAAGAAPLKGCTTDVQRFLAELAALGVATFIEDSADAVRARVTEVVGGRAVLMWSASCLPYNVAYVLPQAVTESSPRGLQAAADIGVTGCDAAIAETGSLVFMSGEGKPRTASLLPPVHLAIVQRGDVRATMGEFFRERAADIAASACCTFVTGPSRTADIELTLTLGVHGPGQVIVVLGP